MSLFRCEPDGGGGSYVLVEPELSCESDEYRTLFLLGVCFSAFYFLVVPFAVFWVVFLRIPKYGPDERRTVLLFGFLYRRFDPRCHWWEAIEIIRKGVFVLVILWVNNRFDEEVPRAGQIGRCGRLHCTPSRLTARVPCGRRTLRAT